MLTISTFIDKRMQINPNPPQDVLRWCDPIYLSKRFIQFYQNTIKTHPLILKITLVSISAIAIISAAYLTPYLLSSIHEVRELFTYFNRREEFGTYISLFSEIHKTIQIAAGLLICWETLKWSRSRMV